MRRLAALWAIVPLALIWSTALPSQAAADPALVGQFSAPFEEDPQNQVYTVPADSTDPKGTEHCIKTKDSSGNDYLECKPTAVSNVVLPDGRLLFWSGLQGFENIKTAVVPEGWAVSRNSKARLLDISGSTPAFAVPTPDDGGATNPDLGTAGPPCPAPGCNGVDPNKAAQGDMFCSDQVHLADGKVLIAGGTAWYNDFPVAGTPGNVTELHGLKSARIFDSATNKFTQAAPMNYGRWYPGLIELADGKVFVGGGVRRLVQSTEATNVRHTEVYDPAVNKWADNGDPGPTVGFPLFPRFHLLPDGSVYYTASGQMWGPFGESIDDATYALRQAWDPKTNTWTDFGPGMLGARSGVFSSMLTLKPPYNHAEILVGGGAIGVPPGTVVATNATELHSLDDVKGTLQATFAVGPNLSLNRWYSSSVILPNDAVAVFGGANLDSVVSPGSESPVRAAEWYTPWDKKFHSLASGARDRAYHNSAILLPNGAVLVGGHSPLNNGYGAASNSNQATLGTANNFKDPSFEIFKPPYMFKPGRPNISDVQSGIAYGTTFDLHTPDASRISSIRLIRLPAATHITDGNMRSVDLPFTVKNDNTLIVTAPPKGEVAPPGPYYLFINTGKDADTVPSCAAFVSVGATENKAPARIPCHEGALLSAAAGIALLPNTSAAVPASPLIETTALLLAGLVILIGVRRPRRSH